MALLKSNDLKKIKTGKLKPDTRKLNDGGGLYIEVRTLKSGVGMYWRYDYTFAQKRKTYTIGSYPSTTLTEARKRHKVAQNDLNSGIDPAVQKRAIKETGSDAESFKVIAISWLESKEGSQKHKVKIQRYFDHDIFPVLGKLAINEVKTGDIIKVIKRVTSRGSNDQARRVGRWLYNIYRYAKTIGKTQHNPADIDLSMIIPIHITESHAALITPDEVGKLMCDINQYSGYFKTRCLLKLAALLMVRPANLVSMEWQEIDFDKKQWTIEARKLKNRQHIKRSNKRDDWLIVPLASQAIYLLHELKSFETCSSYVFQHTKNKKTHMCPDAIRGALRAMGYDKSEMTAHGFRATARTMLEEQLNWDEKIIELQLGHKVKTHGGAYDRTKHLEKRRKMMQAWADYLDQLANNYLTG